jgi:hypothetical protein
MSACSWLSSGSDIPLSAKSRRGGYAPMHEPASREGA